MSYYITRDTYKGHPLIVIKDKPDDKFAVVQLGSRKAKALLDETVRAELAKFVTETSQQPA
jgi:hypothetical protein